MSRPRRSRHTALVHRHGETPTQKVILCYTVQQAVDYYMRQGYTVIRVVKGDLVNVPQDGGWRLDPVQYRAALDFLGIRWPVVIKQTSRVGGQYGAHRLKPQAGRLVHSITVKSYLRAEDAGRTLWHELCHAMQAERVSAGDPSNAVVAWRNTDERLGSYRNRPIEVEARSYEDFNDEMPLAIPSPTR